LKPVYVKHFLDEIGVGSEEAERLWESDVNGDTGDFCHLARTKNGNLYLSWTDMEEFDGSYLSARITLDDLKRLAAVTATLDAPGDG